MCTCNCSDPEFATIYWDKSVTTVEEARKVLEYFQRSDGELRGLLSAIVMVLGEKADNPRQPS